MALILPGNVASATASTTFSVANSCRFNDADSPRMHKTEGSGNQDKWTFSAWIKRGRFTSGDWYVFRSQIDGSNYLHMRIEGDHQIYVSGVLSDSNNIIVEPSNFLLDPSAWMHVVLAVDTGQAVAANRVKWWINGTQVTSFSRSTYPDQNADTSVNGGGTFTVGATDGGGYAFDGYMAEVCLIDNAQLDADSFGEFDEDSPTIWKPKDVSGLTFGTNGFYLDFEASDNLGNDANGGTDLTEVNLDATDQATDTPTNNFCTLNPLTKWGGWGSSSGAVVLTQGNCHLNEATHASVVGTMATTNMKFYYEVKINASDFSMGVMGSQPEAASGQAYNDPTAYGYYGESSQSYRITAGAWNTDSTFSDTGIYHFAIDPTNNKLWVGKDGTWDGDPAAGSGEIVTLGTHEYMPWVHSSGSAGDNSADVNFGGCSAFTVSSGNADANGYGNFEFAVPSGFYTLCTKNLAEYG